MFIFGEGDFKSDTLEARLVPIFASQIKASFEKNGVSTVVLESDSEFTKNQIKWVEQNFTHIADHFNVDIYDVMRKTKEHTKLMASLPANWRKEADGGRNPQNDYNNGWYYGVKWCADELESLQNERS